MIHEVDEALRRLVRDEALSSAAVDVVFEAPTKEWAARRNAPTVNVYLYDIREDLRRRSRGLINEYDERGLVRSRVVPPRYIKLSYLVTAWTQRPEDEHRLLAALLLATLDYDAVPPGLLTGSVARLGLPLPMTVALPPPEDRAFADVWTALGGELKPSLDVVVSVPVAAGKPIPVGPPVREGAAVEVVDRTDGVADDPVTHRRRLPRRDADHDGAGPDDRAGGDRGGVDMRRRPRA
ncbi:MAG TPA: DUF4255 domain-containing protein [Pilimelia sp.]|nr:DUF4255 domain-containing protein [Pilimelia sp.]